MIHWFWGLGLLGCASSDDERHGTFVGNPSLTARIADNPVQRVASGRFDALEVHVTGCDDPVIPLGPTRLTFDGPDSIDVVPLPLGEHCGMFFVVDQFTVEVRDSERTFRIVADDFDLAVPDSFVARRDGHVVLRFGNESWLAKVATLAPDGETRLGKDVPALTQAFFAGLWEGSEVLSFE